MRIAFLTLLTVSLLVLTTDAYAQQRHGTYKDWRVFSLKQHGKKVCYIASSSISQKGNFKNVVSLIYWLPMLIKNTDEVSTSSGYPYRVDSEVKMVIDKKNTYMLFTKGELAWAHTKEEDKAIVKRMIKGLKLTVRGTSRKGTFSEDTYSLKGFGNAYRKMKSLCKS